MSSRQLEEPTYFLDRSLGKHVVAGALRQAGVRVLLHDDLFAQNAPDEDWLNEAGSHGRIVLTKDSRIRARKNEMEAIRRASARVFALTSTSLTAAEMSGAILAALPSIERACRKADSALLGTIDRSGRVRLLTMDT